MGKVVLGVVAFFVLLGIYFIGPEAGWWNRSISDAERAQHERETEQAKQKAADNARVAAYDAQQAKDRADRFAQLHERAENGKTKAERKLAAKCVQAIDAAGGVEGGEVYGVTVSDLLDSCLDNTADLDQMKRDYVKTQKAAANTLRQTAADKLQTVLLRLGIEANVRANGTTMTINSFACSNVLWQRFEDEGVNATLRASGFAKIRCVQSSDEYETRSVDWKL